MKALIFKEWREHLKWVPIPGLVILLVFYIDKPDLPMPEVTTSYYFCLTAVGFGAALGFSADLLRGARRQAFAPLAPAAGPVANLPGQGSCRRQSLLACHGDTFRMSGELVRYARTYARAVPLADGPSLAGGHSLGSGLLLRGDAHGPAQARWYGSRCLPLAGAFFCSYLVWILPEFWHALVAIGIIGSLVGVAAWGSFLTGGEYTTQPRLARAGLAVTFLAALLIISMLGKQMIGELSDPGFDWNYAVDRQGSVVVCPKVESVGRIGPWTDLDGHELPELKGKEGYSIEAPGEAMETPLDGSYRNDGRFYVEYKNDSKPGNERWFYDQIEGRLVGYDRFFHHFLGSFGPDGFAPARVAGPNASMENFATAPIVGTLRR